MMLSNVNLEMSLKPFRDVSDATRDAVLEKLFRQWAPLVDRADAVSVMLWAADGSEILDYAADLGAKFEWANTIGVANPRWSHASKSDPRGESIHQQPTLHMDNPPEFTYAWLKALVERIKSWPLGKPISVVETFDPGPEFAKSSFKY